MNLTIEQNINDYSLICEPENNQVYDQAVKLYSAGFHITSLHKHKKNPFHDDWNMIRFKPEIGMTGLGIVTGTTCYINDKQYYVFALDIDIYRQERRNNILSRILEQIEKPVYLEKTPSGGYRIIFYCEILIENKSTKFNFAEVNDAAQHKDNIDFFAGNKQVLIAPSKAENKNHEIGEYKQISEVGLMESAILNEYELKSLLTMLDSLSHEYSSQVFQHQHSILPETREKIRQLHLYLKSEGCKTGPLYNGERHCSIPNWKNGVDDSLFEKVNLTGITLKLGRQTDGSYLNCFDIDIKYHKFGELPMDVLERFKVVFGESFYAEQSVSGGYHIIFKTEKSLDMNRKWKLADGQTLEVLSSNQDTINIAPTSAYINKYKFSGYPEYGIGLLLSDIRSISTVDAEAVKTFVNSLEPARTSISFNNVKYNSNSAENRAVKQYMQQFDRLSAIDRQIKAVFQNIIDLLDALGIRNSGRPKSQYMNFFSLYADDGNNPDAILFYNNNKNPKNTWSGYSVQDFHSGEVMAFGQYLCKYRQDLFDMLMEKIGYGRLNRLVPITTTFRKTPIVYKCGQYISDELRMQILNDINEAIRKNQGNGKQTKILITAPTGVGKTEMFYRLAEDQQIRMILALSYTSQVLQGKETHTRSGVLQGMCQNDSEVPETGSIFMTYDKSPIVEKTINPEEYIMVIDEAHNLVNHSDFRGKALQNLQYLSDRCKSVVYMTATPEYLNHNDVDMVIKIEQENRPLKQAHVCKYKKGSTKRVVNALLSQHIPGETDVIYARSKKQLVLMEKLIQQRSIKTHVLYSDIKNDSEAYSNLSKYQTLSSKGCLQEGIVLLTTNLIVDGVNILDNNIGNIFLVDIKSTTDLIQFPSRFRNGFKNYFLFVSGSTPAYVEKKTRQELTEKDYNLALKQKQSYDIFKYNVLYPLVSSGIPTEKIALTDRYRYLDDNGEISENIVLKHVQETEARRMNYNVCAIEEFVKAYNFTVTEVPQEAIISNRLTNEEIEQAKLDLTGETVDKITILCKILINKDNVYTSVQQELLKDYLKKKSQQFEVLSIRWNITEHKSTGKFKEIWSSLECMDALYRYCTGLELNAEKPFLLLYKRDYSNKDIDSMKRTYRNLNMEMDGVKPKPENRYYRFIELRRCVRELKAAGVTLILSPEQLLAFVKYFNSRYAPVYNEGDIKAVLEDLKDIFDVKKVEKRLKNGKKVNEYHVKEEWSLNNIQGLQFRRSTCNYY